MGETEYIAKIRNKVVIGYSEKPNVVLTVLGIKRDDNGLVDLITDSNLDIVYENGFTPLFYALIIGHEKAIKHLVSRGASLEIVNDFGTPITDWTPREKFFGRSAFTSFGDQIWNEAISDRLKTREEVVAISAMKRKELKDVIKILSTPGFQVDKKFKGGYTLLHYAAIYDFPLAVAYLLDNGADLSVKSDNGISVSEWIKNYGSKFVKMTTEGKYHECVKLEIAQTKEKLRAKIEGSYDSKIFSECIKAAKTDDVFLASNIISKSWRIVNMGFFDNYTFLYLAAIFDAPRVAAYLVANGANINACDSHGQKLSEWVLNFGASDVILAIKGKNDAEEIKRDVRREFQDLLAGNFQKMLEMRTGKLSAFIDGRCSFDVNIEYEGYSLLFYVVVFNQVELAEFLISKGANKFTRSHDDISLPYWVKFNGTKEMIAVFKEQKTEEGEKYGFGEMKKFLAKINKMVGEYGEKRAKVRKPLFIDELEAREKKTKSAWAKIPSTPENPRLTLIRNKLEQTAKSLSSHGEDEMSKVIETIRKGDVEKFTEMIFAEAFDTTEKYGGYGLLHLAMIYDNVEVSKFLIENGMANVEEADTIPAKTWAEMYGSEKIRDLFA